MDEREQPIVPTVAIAAARGVLAAKGGLVAGLVVAATTAVLALALGCAMVGAAFQSSTAVWPVPAATDAAGRYQAAGWSVTSQFGWRDNPLAPGRAEFHDGIDLAGPALCRGCPAAALFDAEVAYLGWDSPGAAQPDRASGGQTVRIESGGGAYEVLYAHLEPYRLYVQLQGRVEDRFGRYDELADYRPVGEGELQPEGEVSIWCDGATPDFVASRVGPGTLMFTYDRPASCRTSVSWGAKGDGWDGWVADEPGGASPTLSWSTPVNPGISAGDVALRFRAHLTPPPPPPTAAPVLSDTATLEPTPDAKPATLQGAAPRCDAQRCTWRLAAIPDASMPTALSAEAGQGSVGGPALALDATPAAASPRLALVLTSSRANPARGQLVTLAASLFSDAPVARAASVSIDLGGALELLDATASAGRCAGDTCETIAGAGQPATLRFVARVLSDAPRGRATVRATASSEGAAAADDITFEIADLLIEEPWPPPTIPPTPTAAPTTPTPAPAQGSPEPGAPRATPAGDASGAACLRAVQAALSRQGARYSQGGALPGDPRGPDGLPLPRTGPASFDCSGLVWWSYAQAGVPLGRTTYQQVSNGARLPCTLDDLRGVFTRCWAPGDLIFLRYPAGQHVAIYAGGGLFMDCFNHRVGCVLHDVSQDAFYRAHFLQARRVASGCEGMALDPGAPVEAPLDGLPQGDAPNQCVAGQPSFSAAVETLPGCGPPVRLGQRVYQLDTTVGFVGLTGATTGPHLHLGLRARSYDGAYHATDICTSDWLRGRAPPPDADCWTEMADPLDFMPRALGGETTADGTPIAADAPYQLPPPGQPGALALTPAPGATPVGQYWSPFADGGRYGGPPAIEWLRGLSCAAWKELPWCR